MTEERAVRWLNDAEMAAWRSYIVATLLLRQRLHRELTECHEVSLTDYEVLVCLQAQPGRRMRMSELAFMMGSTKSRLSHQVAKLEDAGLVRRVRDPEDKRGVITELTDEGLALLEKAAPTHVEGVREHLIDLLTPQEQATIAAAFERVQAHLLAAES
ncbi:MarR family winged helix-turn-helix transcriptional regulator [Amycolatopsis sp. MtRt-6]|uniref:MarR family winged helix-turn-helix transcriptional regulator n=1 Tax=Amycolatopsis sp. MtRt-6 TaxID=2792782 RepID=UPI001A8C709E|nr:MarR family transcriptional regulator [Amycolatopsis sp. MtRt-6]